MRLNAGAIITGVAYFITNKKSNTVLDLSGSDPKHANITGWDYNGGDNQQWTFEHGSKSFYKIKNVAHEKYIGFSDSFDADGDNQFVVGKASPIEWIAFRLDDGTYRFAVPIEGSPVPNDNSLVLDLDESSGNISVSGVGAVLSQDYSQTWQLNQVG